MLSTLLAEVDHDALGGVDPIVFGGIAAVVFLVLGLVTWSYRDVANRHSDKTAGQDSAGHGHH